MILRTREYPSTAENVEFIKVNGADAWIAHMEAIKQRNLKAVDNQLKVIFAAAFLVPLIIGVIGYAITK